ncbi:hypothetical protein F5B21DRAFT_76832 [Xylaria acuta]|nr:hypothetical protein F5B21DRAFT_76832 [Xylaria acuta]
MSCVAVLLVSAGFPGAGRFLEPVVFSETTPRGWIIRWQKRAATGSGVAVSKTTPTRRSVPNSSDRGIGPTHCPSCRCGGVVVCWNPTCECKDAILDDDTPAIDSRPGKALPIIRSRMRLPSPGSIWAP